MQSETARTAIAVVRIITRLNIGGPSIQATRLSAIDNDGFLTTLIHGRLGEGEGDMSYLIEPGARAIYVHDLCRPLSPLNDLRAFIRILGELRRARPRVVHTHMAKAGLIGRLAAAVYNLTRGQAPRARVVHTYHGHVLEGYFSPVMTRVFISIERLLARFSDAIIAISPAIEAQLRDQFRIGRASQYRVVPLGFDLSSFAAVTDADRPEFRRVLPDPLAAHAEHRRHGRGVQVMVEARLLPQELYNARRDCFDIRGGENGRITHGVRPRLLPGRNTGLGVPRATGELG